MPPDATATKSRILDAALAEFAEYGLAGARVDRIAERADANKRSIYVHFGNKEDLFDLVVARALARAADAVPFTPDNLAMYAAGLFDHVLANRELSRLAGWAQFERPNATAAESDAYRPKVDAIAQAQQDGLVTTRATAVDVLALVLGLTSAWFNASPALRDLAPQQPWSPERLASHRAALVTAVQAVVTP